MTKSTTALADYEVTVTRSIGGIYRKAGETVQMTPKAAKYYLPPYGNGLKPATTKSAPKAKPADTPAKGDAPTEG